MKCTKINITQNVWPFINKKDRSQYISISAPSDHC